MHTQSSSLLGTVPASPLRSWGNGWKWDSFQWPTRFSFKPAGPFARKRVNCAVSYSPFAYVCDQHQTLYSSKNFLQKTDFSGVKLGSHVPPLLHSCISRQIKHKITQGLTLFNHVIIWSNLPHTFVLILWNNKSSLYFHPGTKQLHASVQTGDWLLGCSPAEKALGFWWKKSWTCVSSAPLQ